MTQDKIHAHVLFPRQHRGSAAPRHIYYPPYRWVNIEPPSLSVSSLAAWCSLTTYYHEQSHVLSIHRSRWYSLKCFDVTSYASLGNIACGEGTPGYGTMNPVSIKTHSLLRLTATLAFSHPFLWTERLGLHISSVWFLLLPASFHFL